MQHFESQIYALYHSNVGVQAFLITPGLTWYIPFQKGHIPSIHHQQPRLFNLSSLQESSFYFVQMWVCISHKFISFLFSTKTIIVPVDILPLWLWCLNCSDCFQKLHGVVMSKGCVSNSLLPFLSSHMSQNIWVNWGQWQVVGKNWHCAPAASKGSQPICDYHHHDSLWIHKRHFVL